MVGGGGERATRPPIQWGRDTRTSVPSSGGRGGRGGGLGEAILLGRFPFVCKICFSGGKQNGRGLATGKWNNFLVFTGMSEKLLYMYHLLFILFPCSLMKHAVASV